MESCYKLTDGNKAFTCVWWNSRNSRLAHRVICETGLVLDAQEQRDDRQVRETQAGSGLSDVGLRETLADNTLALEPRDAGKLVLCEPPETQLDDKWVLCVPEIRGSSKLFYDEPVLGQSGSRVESSAMDTCVALQHPRFAHSLCIDTLVQHVQTHETPRRLRPARGALHFVKKRLVHVHALVCTLHWTVLELESDVRKDVCILYEIRVGWVSGSGGRSKTRWPQ